MGIENKTIIITGASSGIGEATAKMLGLKGARLVLAGRRDDRLQLIKEAIIKKGGHAIYKITDVRKRCDMDALVETAKYTFGGIDVLINNAGIMPMTPLRERHYDEWYNTIDTNIKGVLNGIGAILPEFYEKKSGHIISLASVAAHQTNYGGAAYAASKFAVWAIMDTLRKEVAHDGTNIRVTTISPGAINTELLNSITSPDMRKAFEDKYKQVGITPVSVAQAICFAIDQAVDVGINEIILRPTLQEV